LVGFIRQNGKGGPASRIGEAGPFWSAAYVWRHRVYYGAAVMAFP